MESNTNMTPLNVHALIELIRDVTADEVKRIPFEVPSMPATINTGERLYETNLRLVLRYLKQIIKICKRQDSECAEKIQSHRFVMRCFHDVDEWAFNYFVEHDYPFGVAARSKDGLTAAELREALNDNILADIRRVEPQTVGGSPNGEATCCQASSSSQECLETITEEPSPDAESLKNSSVPFQFHGSTNNLSPTHPAPKMAPFKFRCTSDAIYHRDASRNPDSTNSRHVSAPVTQKEKAKYCFLELTGETLKEFILGVEVDGSKVENKLRWLSLLDSPAASPFLGRWPSPSKLHEFMREHGLEWVFRVAGTWDRLPQMMEARATVEEAVLEQLASSTALEEHPAAFEEVELLTHVEAAEEANASANETTDSEPTALNTPDSYDSESMPEESLVNLAECNTSSGECLATEPSPFEDPNGNLHHTSVFLSPEAQADDTQDDGALDKVDTDDSVSVSEALEEFDDSMPSPHEDPNGNLYHVFPFLIPEAQVDYVAHGVTGYNIASEESPSSREQPEPIEESVAATKNAVEESAPTNKAITVEEAEIASIEQPQTTIIAQENPTEQTVSIQEDNSVNSDANTSASAASDKSDVAFEEEGAMETMANDNPDNFSSVILTSEKYGSKSMQDCLDEEAKEPYTGNLGHVFPWLAACALVPASDTISMGDDQATEANEICTDNEFASVGDEEVEPESNDEESIDCTPYTSNSDDEADDIEEVAGYEKIAGYEEAAGDEEVAGGGESTTSEADEEEEQVDVPGEVITIDDFDTTAYLAGDKVPAAPAIVVIRPDGDETDLEEEAPKAFKNGSMPLIDPSHLAPTALSKKKADAPRITQHNADIPPIVSDSVVNDENAIYTPPKWSLVPIFAGAAMAAIFVTARCPLLTTLGVSLTALTMLSKAKR